MSYWSPDVPRHHGLIPLSSMWYYESETSIPEGQHHVPSQDDMQRQPMQKQPKQEVDIITAKAQTTPENGNYDGLAPNTNSKALKTFSEKRGSTLRLSSVDGDTQHPDVAASKPSPASLAEYHRSMGAYACEQLNTATISQEQNRQRCDTVGGATYALVKLGQLGMSTFPRDVTKQDMQKLRDADCDRSCYGNRLVVVGLDGPPQRSEYFPFTPPPATKASQNTGINNTAEHAGTNGATTSAVAKPAVTEWIGNLFADEDLESEEGGTQAKKKSTAWFEPDQIQYFSARIKELQEELNAEKEASRKE